MKFRLTTIALLSSVLLTPLISLAQISDAPAADSESMPTVSPTPEPTPYPPLSDAVLGKFEVLKTIPLTGRVAFAATIDGIDRIMLLDLDSRKVSQLINGPGGSSTPQWSPDGHTLAYTCEFGSNAEICSADWKGEQVQRLTINPERDTDPAWAPDGSRIVYYAEDSKRNSNIFTMSPQGTGQIQVTHFEGRNVAPRWSPDGKYISYSTNRFWPGWDICVWDLNARGESCILAGRDSFFRADWAHSSDRIAYSYGNGEEIQIGVFSTKDNSQTPISEMTGKEYDPVWSPNDQAIIFTSEDPDHPGLFNLYVHDMQSAKNLLLVRSPYSARYPAWNALSQAVLENDELASKYGSDGAPGETPVPTVTPLEMPDAYVPPYLQNKRIERKKPSPPDPAPTPSSVTPNSGSAEEQYEAIEWGK